MSDVKSADVHALLAEHFNVSRSKYETGFSVKYTDPVVVSHVLGYEYDAIFSKTELRATMLNEYNRILRRAGYETTNGVAARDEEPVLVVLTRES